jgi:hypothetical protein
LQRFRRIGSSVTFESSNGLKGITLALEENSCRSERNIVALLLHDVIRGLNTFLMKRSGNENVWFGEVVQS